MNPHLKQKPISIENSYQIATVVKFKKQNLISSVNYYQVITNMELVSIESVRFLPPSIIRINKASIISSAVLAENAQISLQLCWQNEVLKLLEMLCKQYEKIPLDWD